MYPWLSNVYQLCVLVYIVPLFLFHVEGTEIALFFGCGIKLQVLGGNKMRGNVVLTNQGII